MKCRRGHHGVPTRGARAADHGIDDEWHARRRALSQAVGPAAEAPGHGSVSIACQLCGQSRRGLARASAPAAHCRVSATSIARPRGVTTMPTNAPKKGREERRALLEQRRAVVARELRRLANELRDIDRQLDEIEQSER